MFQDTLIVWSENDTTELALSFQERAGCDEIWYKICQVNPPTSQYHQVVLPLSSSLSSYFFLVLPTQLECVPGLARQCEGRLGGGAGA